MMCVVYCDIIRSFHDVLRYSSCSELLTVLLFYSIFLSSVFVVGIILRLYMFIDEGHAKKLAGKFSPSVQCVCISASFCRWWCVEFVARKWFCCFLVYDLLLVKCQRVLTSEGRLKGWQCPFPQDSVGCWRKDDVSECLQHRLTTCRSSGLKNSANYP